MKVAIVLLAVVAFVAADIYPPNAAYYPPARYDFNYAVKEAKYDVDMGHKEYRNGDSTRGEYFVVLPDGRRQTVTYYVNGDSGYVAEVKYY